MDAKKSTVTVTERVSVEKEVILLELSIKEATILYRLFGLMHGTNNLNWNMYDKLKDALDIPRTDFNIVPILEVRNGIAYIDKE